MDLYQELVEFWGDSLVTYPKEEIDKFTLPHKTKYFLQFVGLPMKHKMPSDLFGFYFLNHLEKIFFREKEYISIGNFYDESCKLCIEPKTEKLVILYDYKEEKAETRLLNSNLVSFVKFLKYIDIFDNFYESKRTFYMMMKNLLDEDYKVFEDEDSFWSCYFFDIYMGFDDEDEENFTKDLDEKTIGFIKTSFLPLLRFLSCLYCIAI
jgi:hypothetical protein